MQKTINHSVLQKKNLEKKIKVKLSSNDRTISGILKGYNNFEVHLEKSNNIYTINKGSIMYMVLA